FKVLASYLSSEFNYVNDGKFDIHRFMVDLVMNNFNLDKKVDYFSTEEIKEIRKYLINTSFVNLRKEISSANKNRKTQIKEYLKKNYRIVLSKEIQYPKLDINLIQQGYKDHTLFLIKATGKKGQLNHIILIQADKEKKDFRIFDDNLAILTFATQQRLQEGLKAWQELYQLIQFTSFYIQVANFLDNQPPIQASDQQAKIQAEIAQYSAKKASDITPENTRFTNALRAYPQ
ncbi:MAG: hypothetical protein AAF443_03635, partial [Chlamydiota bacterium]